MEALIGFAVVLADASSDHHMDWDGGWWIVMMIGMVVFWALVVLGIVWLVRELSGRRGWPGRHPDPLELLDRRLAEGAISLEDYRERRAVLSGTRGPGEGEGG